MVGPAVEAVVEWLVTRRIPSAPREPSVGAAAASPAGSLEYIVSMFQAMARPATSAAERTTEYSSSSNIGEHSPASLSCGVMVHLFLSSQQDGCGREKVAVSDVSDDAKSSRRWICKVSKTARDNNISIHVWGVAAFSHQNVGLSDLLPLCTETGGKVHKFVLGQYPSIETKRLCAQVARVFSEQVASKCIMKIRTSAVADSKSLSVIGNFHPDENLPGVYRIPACGSDDSFGLFIDYSKAEGTDGADLQTFVLQVAFSYSTLVESEEDMEEAYDSSLCHSGDDKVAQAQQAPDAEPTKVEFISSGYQSIPVNLLHPEKGVIVISGGQMITSQTPDAFEKRGLSDSFRSDSSFSFDTSTPAEQLSSSEALNKIKAPSDLSDLLSSTAFALGMSEADPELQYLSQAFNILRLEQDVDYLKKYVSELKLFKLKR